MKFTAHRRYPIGILEVTAEDGAITRLERVDLPSEQNPDSLCTRALDELDEYFAGTRTTFDLPLNLHGTDFRMRVWRALASIPYGDTRSYADIAREIGSPRACRAVGGANHANPIVILVPCHRVVNSDGSLGGYGCGVGMKKYLLNLEKYTNKGINTMLEPNYWEFFDFLNYVFGFNGADEDFIALLPKLYRPEDMPLEHNHIIRDETGFKAAIGVYDRTLDVLGECLSVHGIGNVAVHPRARSKGYMRELMKTAVDKMIADGADMSDLGGIRQRYGYFSYENASPVIRFELHSDSMRYAFGKSEPRSLDLVNVNDGNSPLLDAIFAMHESKPAHFVRDRSRFLDIVHSWHNELTAILDGERLIGYFVGKLTELTLADEADFDDVIRTYVKNRGGVTLVLPLHEQGLIARAARIASSFSMGDDQCYTVFHWSKVVAAFMKLKASVCPLIDGELKVHVRGIAGDEVFAIRVADGIPEVSAISPESAELTLEHREAVAFFFGLVSPTRMQSALASAWLPLPLYFPPADHV